MVKRFVLTLAVCTCVAGCSEMGSSANTASDGPHGGALVELPEGAGFAEVFTEESAIKAQRRGRIPRAIVVYFLGPDKKTALSPRPTDVAVKFVGVETAPAVEIAPAPDPKDPAAAGRFASRVGDFDLSRRSAELSADLGGKKIMREFRGPR